MPSVEGKAPENSFLSQDRIDFILERLRISKLLQDHDRKGHVDGIGLNWCIFETAAICRRENSLSSRSGSGSIPM